MTGAEAIIVLSLLGCDDSGTQCDYLRASEQRFASVAECRVASDAFLAASDDAEYPAVVAICAPAVETAGRPVPPELPVEVAPEIPADELAPDMVERIAGAIAGYVPGRETLARPVGVAAEGAAKVGSAVIVGVKRVAEAVNPF
ncbi:hypothetical protein [Oricola thermophila]|uniref:Uncharacterized protein n=1 Tax=Oricola thermophila TaxID=2742145 RepID=A0A6N1VEC2_9HYPH|nr:hypothetical protein [Oricola thermophila]QKV19290.1 hypothetical protein HTY61_12895 [Oricola thermophila]